MNIYNISIVFDDLYRYCGEKSITKLIKFYFINPGYNYIVWMRLTYYFKILGPFVLPIYLFFRFILKRKQIKYGISIPYNTKINKGFYIGHYGGIVINPYTKIGKNCNINHGVTVGATYGGKNPGVPTIGNDVYIGPGTFIIGGISIGDNVVIGANSVVTKSIPKNAVVAGNPVKILSSEGAQNYIVNKV